MNRFENIYNPTKKINSMDKNYYTNLYGNYDEIDLPRTYRTYLDAFCAEFSNYPNKQKLLDLAYVIIHGFDLKKAIKKIIKSHSYISENSIRRAIASLLSTVNHTDIDCISLENSLDTDIDIFIEDLIRYYRLPMDYSNPHYLVEDFRHVSEMEVYKCNGWELASENVNKYQMYKDDDFVFYPGDCELLQRYHEHDTYSGEIDEIFSIGPCPEPWYGNPMTAKVIILGNMPVYDDYISRCSNLVLSLEPRLMEEVQGVVRSWMCLSGKGMYNDKEFGVNSDLHIGDTYNSTTYRHWVDEVRLLANELKIDNQDMLDRVCVINANAYYSVGGNDPLVAGMLPSQYYLRILLNYLMHKDSDRPLMIIPSSSLYKTWKEILGYWIGNEFMLSSDKIIINKNNPQLSLSSNLIGKRNCKIILERIN